jgi:hypothetical protein
LLLMERFMIEKLPILKQSNDIRITIVKLLGGECVNLAQRQ